MTMLRARRTDRRIPAAADGATVSEPFTVKLASTTSVGGKSGYGN